MTRGLRLVGGAVLVVLALVGLRSLLGRGLGPAVAVVDIRGVIDDVTEELDLLGALRRDDGAVAVVLRIDSPGGAVAPSQELYDEVVRLREHKPVVASLGNVAASGGYYVASAAQVVVADPGTLTGSIGAIMAMDNYAALASKVGYDQSVVKSGRFKDIGHPLRPLTDDERLLLQGMVDDILSQFVQAVAKGRNVEPERIRAVADGRLFSGAQAQAAGLVDELGGMRRAVEIAWERAGRAGEPTVRRQRIRHWPRWMQLLDGLAGSRNQLGGGLLFLYGGAAPH